MIQLSTFLWFMIGLFAVVGYLRGWTKEWIATAGIVFALFTLKQLETVIIDPLTQGQHHSKFYLQAAILIGLAFISYQTPPERFSRGSRRSSNRENLQESILGALLGGINGYLLFGALWWYMDNLEYPLSPHILPVVPGSSSANMVNVLPLNWMMAGDGSLLSLIMIGLFVFIFWTII
jgi:uncharacterized membrane protein required for colicin V production